MDDNGYPEHNRVAQGLLKNAKGRELRDFIQDSTDECFQLMDQGKSQYKNVKAIEFAKTSYLKKFLFELN